MLFVWENILLIPLFVKHYAMTEQQNTWGAVERSRTPRAPRVAPMPDSRPQKPEKVPLWIVIMFIFALAFCLFAVYKAFIYKQGYNEGSSNQEVIDVNFQQDTTGEDLQENGITNILTGDVATTDVVSWEIATEASANVQRVNPSLSVSWSQTWTQSLWTTSIDRSGDTALIEQFYKHLVANEFDAMNALVQGPLLRSNAWKDHWNAKNLGIFSRNLVGNLNLDNLFFVANSVDEAKKSRQYSYTLSYTIQPDHQYKEDRKITLVTQGTGKVLISEIMCETKWCSRSPFFWPQNLGLK